MTSLRVGSKISFENDVCEDPDSCPVCSGNWNDLSPVQQVKKVGSTFLSAQKSYVLVVKSKQKPTITTGKSGGDLDGKFRYLLMAPFSSHKSEEHGSIMTMMDSVGRMDGRFL